MCMEETCGSLGNVGRGRRDLNKRYREMFIDQRVEVIRHCGRSYFYLESGLFKN